MEKERFDSLVAENMKTILGFALTRLSDRQRAEELASDIIFALLKSASKLRDEEKFYAFMWTVAERTYADYLRARYRSAKTREVHELDENVADAAESALDGIVKREELFRLRRELSLLSEQHRRATVLYYMEDNSCSEIAGKLEVSTEMVKYYLFRARKLIREGMEMDRILGEMSYKPSRFEIDFWGTRAGDDNEYRDFYKRRIKGNILLAAYYTPVTAQEISVELGVSMPYLGDELAILVERQYLIEKNGRYVTNIPIFTSDCRDAIRRRIDELAAESVAGFAAKAEGAFAERYGDRFRSENLMRWQMVTLAVSFALSDTDGTLEREFGKLPDNGIYSHIRGGSGVVWGRATDDAAGNGGNISGISGIYNGAQSEDGRGSVTAINFAETLNAQRFVGGEATPLVAAAVGCYEYLPDVWQKQLTAENYVTDEKPNFAVWTEEEHKALRELLREPIAVITELIKETSAAAADITADMAPEHIRDSARYVGALVYRFDAIERIVAELFRSEWLLPVEDADKPAMYAVTK